MKVYFETRLTKIISCIAVAFILSATTEIKAQTVWQSYSRPAVGALPLRIDRGSVGLWQTLMKLRTRASIMMIVAHPDDEDGGMLAYESRRQGARTILLTLNRGEGGQNLMSSDFWDALGVLRTEELLAADRYYGAQQYFTRLVDFGFSKSLEESLEQWGRERTLYDVVRVIRMTRPLVITSVWVGGPSDGHGQHQVAGEIAQEAFKAAANPSVFPDQIRAGLRPWQALKFYARVPFISITSKGMYDYADRRWYPVGVYDYIHHRWLPGIPATNVRVPEGQYNPFLGLSYRQLGAEGLNCQKSQNGGVAMPPLGVRDTRYHQYAPVPSPGVVEKSFFDGINTSLMGIASLAIEAKGNGSAVLNEGLSRINRQVEEAISDFSATRPSLDAATLARGLEETTDLLARVEQSSLPGNSKYNVEFELRVKQNEFNTALLQALGLRIRAWVVPKPVVIRNPFGAGLRPVFPLVVPGQKFWVEVRLINPSNVPVRLQNILLKNPFPGERWVSEGHGSRSGVLVDNKPFIVFFHVTAPENASYTRPYYSRPNIERAYYNILDPRYLNLPFAPYPLAAWANLDFHGTRFRVGQVVQAVERERGYGDIMQPLVVGPAISISVSPRAGIIPLKTRKTSLTVTIESNVQRPAQGMVRLQAPAGWSTTPPEATFDIAKAGEKQSFVFHITASELHQEKYTVAAIARFQDRDYRQGFETVGYPGLRPYNFYRPTVYRTAGVDISIPKNLRVGYITGTGDRVPQSIASIGIKVHVLSSRELAAGRLSIYDAIVLGVRAYAARPELKTYNSRLLGYVKRGGVLIVQYATPQYDHDYGPYPYSLTRNPQVVVDERSQVRILEPSNPVLRWPNEITEKDFEGWVEERGHSFMTTWNPHYQALFETHDPGQPPQKGGLLYASYGKGVYIYDAYALYRQLPQGVPGAYRLFVNMMSLARNPLRAR